MDMLAGIYQKLGNTFSPTHKKRSRERSRSSCKKGDNGKSDSSSDGMLHNEEWSAGELEEEEEDDDNDEESSSSSDEFSPDTSDLE